MAKDFQRAERIGDQVQRELAELLRLEVKDPRVKMVTITGVEVSRDYSHAKIFYTTLAGNDPQILRGLTSASAFLRRELGRRIMLRVTPELHFVFDESVERGAHLSHLIDEAVKSDRHDEGRD
jgi:ribosome-binding factor A